VFYKFKIPKRSDDRGWDLLRQKVRSINLEIQTRILDRIRKEEARLQRILIETPSEREAKRRDLTRKLRLMQKEKSEWLQW
jgi:hypothetical protein